jgi:hypothetical protein
MHHKLYQHWYTYPSVPCTTIHCSRPYSWHCIHCTLCRERSSISERCWTMPACRCHRRLYCFSYWGAHQAIGQWYMCSKRNQRRGSDLLSPPSALPCLSELRGFGGASPGREAPLPALRVHARRFVFVASGESLGNLAATTPRPAQRRNAARGCGLWPVRGTRKVTGQKQTPAPLSAISPASISPLTTDHDGPTSHLCLYLQTPHPSSTQHSRAPLGYRSKPVQQVVYTIYASGHQVPRFSCL